MHDNAGGGGAPAWAFMFVLLSLLGELLMELVSNWIESILGEGSVRIVAVIAVTTVLVGAMVLFRRRTS